MVHGQWGQGARFNIKMSYPYRNPHYKGKTWDRLIFIMYIPCPERRSLCRDRDNAIRMRCLSIFRGDVAITSYNRDHFLNILRNALNPENITKTKLQKCLTKYTVGIFGQVWHTCWCPLFPGVCLPTNWPTVTRLSCQRHMCETGSLIIFPLVSQITAMAIVT